MSKTWGEIADEFLACKTKDEAEAWLKSEVARSVKEFDQTPEIAGSNLRSSLGYMMGYYDDATAARMQKLLDLIHPVLPWVGKEPSTSETSKKAFEIGLEMGKKL